MPNTAILVGLGLVAFLALRNQENGGINLSAGGGTVVGEVRQRL